MKRDRRTNETVTLRKHVAKYKHIQKWMVKFLRKFGSHGIKIAQVTRSHHQIYQFILILYGWGSVEMLTFFKTNVAH